MRMRQENGVSTIDDKDGDDDDDDNDDKNEAVDAVIGSTALDEVFCRSASLLLCVRPCSLLDTDCSIPFSFAIFFVVTCSDSPSSEVCLYTRPHGPLGSWNPGIHPLSPAPSLPAPAPVPAPAPAALEPAPEADADAEEPVAVVLVIEAGVERVGIRVGGLAAERMMDDCGRGPEVGTDDIESIQSVTDPNGQR